MPETALVFFFFFFDRNLRKRENVEIRERAISVINQVFFIVNYDIYYFCPLVIE